MITLTYEEFIIIFRIDNKPIKNIKIEDLGRDISIIPIEISIRDETPHSINEKNLNFIVNLHPLDGNH